MKKIIFLFGLLLSLSALATDFPDSDDLWSFLGIDSDSGIRGPSYKKISEALFELEKKYPQTAEVLNYGKSHAGKPLHIIKIGRKDLKLRHPAVYIGGSIHGNEYLNIEDRLPGWFLEQSEVPSDVKDFLDRGGVIYVAPILNPDGYDKRMRGNDNFVDLNRDFTVRSAEVEGFQEPETRSLVEFLKKDLVKDQRRLSLAMDYHCCIGALLHPWSFTGPVMKPRDFYRHSEIGRIMQANLGPEVQYGTTPVILGYSAKGTSKDFYFEEFGALGFTFEGRRNMEDKFFEDHTKMWSQILKGR